jgi:FtsP/CotA-like multicopper oxidase with cupredoxin domain
MKTKVFNRLIVLTLLFFITTLLHVGNVMAQQIPLRANKIPQFVDPLPDLNIISAGAAQIPLEMKEIQQPVLSTGTFVKGQAPLTWVWSYLDAGQVAIPQTTPIPSYIGPVILATRNVPTEIKFVNNLGSAATTNVLAYKNSTDKTLHWADPFAASGFWNQCNIDSMMFPGAAPSPACATNYADSIPAAVHLHGGEVPPGLDGGPDSWFTSNGQKVGHGYYSKDGLASKNYAIYRYPNTQEAAPIWFHDHTLGATRLNVYAGLAGGYLINDPAITLPVGLRPYGLDSTGADNTTLTGDTPIVPLVIQDRMFDTTGQLFFPAVGINLEHPFWVPEFVGDTIVVNGKTWPFKDVAPKRYRFLFLNGSNARTYELFLINKVTGVKGPVMWVIGTDGGYLDTPQKIDPNLKPNDKLIIMPGERYDVIIDFAGLPANTVLELRNTAKTPYPNGAPVSGSTTGKIMQIRVNQPFTGPDTSFNPATAAVGSLRQGNPIERLPGAPGGQPISTANVQVKRQLTLNEVMGPGGPLEVLLNNTKLSGDTTAGNNLQRQDFSSQTYAGSEQFFSELPNEGDTEVWEIINMTADAHPIHLHLVQFQIINRQAFNAKNYTVAYNAVFPAANDPMTPNFPPVGPGVYIPGYGPPGVYTAVNADGAVGGNPAITPFVQGAATLPAPHEQGWKDTVVTYPGQVTRIVVRWAPTHLPVGTAPRAAFFPFSPNEPLDFGSTVEHGYVWHCHIIDHEDNEMMRPTLVVPLAEVPRSYTKGDY